MRTLPRAFPFLHNPLASKLSRIPFPRPSISTLPSFPLRRPLSSSIKETEPKSMEPSSSMEQQPSAFSVNDSMPYTLDQRTGAEPWEGARNIHIGETVEVPLPSSVSSYFPGLVYTDREDDKHAIIEYNHLGYNVNREPLFTQRMLDEKDEQGFKDEHIQGLPGLVTTIDPNTNPVRIDPDNESCTVRSSAAGYFLCESPDEAFAQYLQEYTEHHQGPRHSTNVSPSSPKPI